MFLPQLTFLFLLLDGIVVEDARKNPTLEILRADGKPFSPRKAGLLVDWALQDFHMMFNHMEVHGNSKYGMIRVAFNIDSGLFALLWMPEFEGPEYVYSDDGKMVRLDSATGQGRDEADGGVEVKTRDPASLITNIESNTIPLTDEDDTSTEDNTDGDIVYRADSVPTENEPGHSIRILVEGRMNRPEGPWKQRGEVNRRTIGPEHCPHCQKDSAEGDSVDDEAAEEDTSSA